MFESLTSLLSSFEADVPHMYLDTRGNVTVGVGHLLSTAQEAYGLPFRLPSGLQAEPHDILNDYTVVKHSMSGRTVAYYAQIADLRLNEEDRSRLLQLDVARTYSELSRRIPSLSKFPPPAQDALVNMAFQLGPRGMVADYPMLMAACYAGNWTLAAEQCSIQDAQPARNEANKNFFLSIL